MNDWKQPQDQFVRHVLAIMARRRMTTAQMCKAAGISVDHWNKAKNLKRTLSVDSMVKIAAALNVNLKFERRRV